MRSREARPVRLRAVRAPLSSCLSDGCRFSRGYDAGVVFSAPPGTRSLAPVYVFATDAALGYPHLSKHFPWLTGDAVVEQLRLAWRPARLTVATTSPHTQVWVVDHPALEATFDHERVKLIAKPCSAYGGSDHCCGGCERRDLPDRMTLRSVLPWERFGFVDVVYTDVTDVERTEYLTDQPDDWIGATFEILSPAQIRRWPRSRPSSQREGSERKHGFHYAVPLAIGGKRVTTRVVADPAQSDEIAADAADFARRHDVSFRRRATNGLLQAYFTPRRLAPRPRGG